MRSPRPRLTPRALPLPRPTARLRLTALYSALFLIAGAVVLAITYLRVQDVTTHGKLQFAPPRAGAPPSLLTPAKCSNSRPPRRTSRTPLT